MAASPITSRADLQLRSDIQLAKKVLSESPHRLTHARAQGLNEKVCRIEQRVAWAQALLTKHGQAVGPLPGRAIASTPPAAPGTASRRDPDPGHTSSPPKGQAPMTTQAASDALWGEAIAGLNASDGLTTASPPAAHHDQVSPARRVETGAGVSGASSAAAWDAAVADVNADNGLTPQIP